MRTKWLLLAAVLASVSCCEKQLPRQVVSRQIATLEQATDLLGPPDGRRPWRDDDGRYFHSQTTAALASRAKTEIIEFHHWIFKTTFGRTCVEVVAVVDGHGRVLALNTSRPVQ